MPAPPLPDRANLRVRRYPHFIPRRPSAAGRMLYESTWLASASRQLVREPVDAAIGVVPSLSGGLLAYLTARRYGARMGLIFQDLMGLAAAESGYQGGRRVARVTTRVEGFLARRADRIAVISDGFRPYLEQLGVAPDRIDRVRNWSHLEAPTESVEQTRARLRWAETDFVCLHAGNMGRKQGLDNLLDAARLIGDQTVRIVLAGDGNDRARLVARAQALGLRNVSFLDLQPAGQFESMLQAADVLLLNQRGTMGDFALPSKLSAYLLAGRPVVAAIALSSSAAAEFAAAGGGIAVPPEDPPALVEAIVRLKKAPEAARQMGGRGRDYARQNLVAGQALAQYDAFVDRLLGGRRR
jgi:colanic acid biosynthesis glycosyl transferase WcaI